MWSGSMRAAWMLHIFQPNVGISLTLHFLILACRLLQSNICLILQAAQVYHWTRSTIAQRTSTMSLHYITQTYNSAVLHKYTSTLHFCLFHTNIYLLRLGSELDPISPHARKELRETIGSPLIVLRLRVRVFFIIYLHVTRIRTNEFWLCIVKRRIRCNYYNMYLSAYLKTVCIIVLYTYIERGIRSNRLPTTYI